MTQPIAIALQRAKKTERNILIEAMRSIVN